MPESQQSSDSPDFRKEFIAEYEKKRKSIKSGVKVAYLECQRPAEQLGLVFKTAGRHQVTVYIDVNKNVAGSVARAKKPQRGLAVMRYWAQAVDAKELFKAVLVTVDEAKGIRDVQIDQEMKERLRSAWLHACKDVMITF